MRALNSPDILQGIYDQNFTAIDVPHFCWLPTQLLTLEIAFFRKVYKRKRRHDGKWEYYNRSQGRKITK
jgi:hypothetical protein